MKKTKIVVLALSIACAVAATSVSSASASLFLAEPPGKVLVKALTNQVFTTAGGTVVCTGVSVSEPPESGAALSSLNLELHVRYENCTRMGEPVTITTARWFYSADNGLVRLLNIFTISFTNCTIFVLPTMNQDLWTVKYLNFGNELAIHHNIANLGSEGTGTACTYAPENKGTYTGTVLVALESGGLLRWDQE